MSYYRSPRRRRRLLQTRAPRKGTLVVAVIFYFIGLFGAFGLITIPPTYTIVALAIAGGLLILGALMRDL